MKGLWSTICSQFGSGGYSGVRESSGAEGEASLTGVVGIDSLTKVGFGWSWVVGSVFGVCATTWIIDSEVDMCWSKASKIILMMPKIIKDQFKQD